MKFQFNWGFEEEDLSSLKKEDIDEYIEYTFFPELKRKLIGRVKSSLERELRDHKEPKKDINTSCAWFDGGKVLEDGGE